MDNGSRIEKYKLVSALCYSVHVPGKDVLGAPALEALAWRYLAGVPWLERPGLGEGWEARISPKSIKIYFYSQEKLKSQLKRKEKFRIISVRGDEDLVWRVLCVAYHLEMKWSEGFQWFIPGTR